MMLIKPIETILPALLPIISNLIKGKLQKEYKIDINFNEITANIANAKIHAHLNTSCVLEKGNLMRILEEAGLI